MLITISGTIASGKTTLAKKIVEKKNNFVYLSAGDIMRKIANERNLSLLELSKIAEENFEIDKEIDKSQREIVKDYIDKGINCIVDGRVSWFVLKDYNIDLKIFLDAPIEVRAKRFSEREHCSYIESLKKIKIRENSERKRFKEIYNIDIDNIKNYDLFLNVEKWNEEGVFKIIEKAIEI